MNEGPASRPTEPGQVGDLLAAALNGLASRIDEMAKEASLQRERLLALEELVGQLGRGRQDHEAWLRSLSQQRTTERLTAGDYMVHQGISARYRDLIGQRLLDAAVNAGAGSPLEEAAIRADLARVLFEPASVQRGPDRGLAELRERGVTVTAELFKELWEAAAEIRSDAAASGHQHEWVLDAASGAVLDPSWQEPCDGCRGTDPVLLVVAPAYRVEDRHYVRQLVFTQPPPAAEEHAPAVTADGEYAPGATTGEHTPGSTTGELGEGAPADAATPSGEPTSAPQPADARGSWWRRLLRRPSAAAGH